MLGAAQMTPLRRHPIRVQPRLSLRSVNLFKRIPQLLNAVKAPYTAMEVLHALQYQENHNLVGSPYLVTDPSRLNISRGNSPKFGPRLTINLA